jgi:hypothetical protein
VSASAGHYETCGAASSVMKVATLPALHDSNTLKEALEYSLV